MLNIHFFLDHMTIQRTSIITNLHYFIQCLIKRISIYRRFLKPPIFIGDLKTAFLTSISLEESLKSLKV
jgi:hypothetical protein